MSNPTSDPEAFSSLTRLYGSKAADLLPSLRFCVVGIGGVGSWTVEALVRSGVGHVTAIDHDDVTASNINRQIHANHDTLGESKVALMQQRVTAINPACELDAIDDFIAEGNLERYLNRNFDVVVDAIDSIRFKAAMIDFCKRQKIPIITTGGAGGRTNPLAVDVCDLSKTWNDALAAKVRSRLRSQYGFPKSPKKRFGVSCVYSKEQPMYPDGHGSVHHQKPGVAGVRLDCEQGYGSAVFVTASFGLVASAEALNQALKSRLKAQDSAG